MSSVQLNHSYFSVHNEVAARIPGFAEMWIETLGAPFAVTASHFDSYPDNEPVLAATSGYYPEALKNYLVGSELFVGHGVEANSWAQLTEATAKSFHNAESC